MNSKWYTIPEKTKINAYNQISAVTGMAPYAVEKDWWVVQVLSAIFEMEIGHHLIFKGGTSLSKAWFLLERFSEDIDIVLDRDYLGFGGELTRNQVKKLRKEAGKYISGKFTIELESNLKNRGLNDTTLRYLKQKSSDADPAKVEVYFPNVIKYPGYIAPRVLLEISSSSLSEPVESRSIVSLLDEHYAEADFSQPAIHVPTVIPERTFLEKLFLLHEEFQRPQEKIRVNRLSRHLYDIYQLLKTDYPHSALANKDLYETIVAHRQSFYHLGGIDYNLHQPQTLNPLPNSELMNAWGEDYKLMQERMIFGDSPSFQIIIETINEFTLNVINRLDWKMDREFPRPG